MPKGRDFLISQKCYAIIYTYENIAGGQRMRLVSYMECTEVVCFLALRMMKSNESMSVTVMYDANDICYSKFTLSSDIVVSLLAIVLDGGHTLWK